MILTMSNREINFLKTISFQSVYVYVSWFGSAFRRIFVTVADGIYNLEYKVSFLLLWIFFTIVPVELTYCSNAIILAFSLLRLYVYHKPHATKLRVEIVTLT